MYNIRCENHENLHPFILRINGARFKSLKRSVRKSSKKSVSPTVVGRRRKIIRGGESRRLRCYETKTRIPKESKGKRKPNEIPSTRTTTLEHDPGADPGRRYRCHDSSFGDLNPPTIVILGVGLLTRGGRKREGGDRGGRLIDRGARSAEEVSVRVASRSSRAPWVLADIRRFAP